MQNPTQFIDIKTLLDELLADIQKPLGEKFKGLYLYGSLVWGDFDYLVSDIDLLAVTSDDMTGQDYDGLEQMHADFASKHLIWENRIEVQYASELGLRSFRNGLSKMAVISPGEPFHVIDAGIDWLTNWYFVQDYGLILFGPSPDQFIDSISKDEFSRAVYDHALFWADYVKQTRNTRPYQSYAVLTLCRALYTVTHEEQVSKQKAAEWTKTQMPEWKDFIDEALYVRAHAGETTKEEADRAFPLTERFVLQAIEKIKRLKG